MNATIQITPSRTINGYLSQLPKRVPESNFRIQDYRIISYRRKGWRNKVTPEWSHFDRVHLAWIDVENGIVIHHVIGITGDRKTFLKCIKLR